MRYTSRQLNGVSSLSAGARLGGLALTAVLVAGAAMTLTSAVAAQAAAPSPSAPSDQGWPRVFTNGDQKVVLYQPQIDKWPEFQQVELRMAVAVTPSGAAEPSYGIVTVQANTSVDYDTRTVLVESPQRSVHFPNVPPEQVPALEAELQQVVPPRSSMVFSLDRALACMQPATAAAGVAVNLNPPTIYYSTQPAILLAFMGQPKFKPIQGTLLLAAINANWDVFLDEGSGSYFLLDGSNNNTWLTSPDPIAGPWSTATSLPSSFSSLPPGAQWTNVLAALPPQGAPLPSATVRVFTSTKPAELIVVKGAPAFEPIIGTQLLAVSNTDSALFQHMPDNTWYYLVAGRWFSAPAPGGPWAAATSSLPADFANIPDDSQYAYVRDSVPGTQAASDAVLLASVPRTATVQRDAVSLNVTYIGGAPKFAPIVPTALSYALNTQSSVIQGDGAYWCCNQAVWFTAADPMGPWTVASQVPPDIYTIPSTSPMYPVTFVRIYGSTPESVTVGYTSGYDGEYVAQTGTLMFGLGETSSPPDSDSSSNSNDNSNENNSSTEDDDYWGSYYQCGPAWYSYGYGACYGGYAYGCYYRGGAAYGPYYGAARATAYNPVTGSWASTGYHYTPYSAAGYRAGYNANTGTAAARGAYSNAYGTWTRGVVTNGDQWARGGTHSTAAATTGWAQTSSGAEAAGVKTANNSAFVAKGPEGNVYAGADGNVYKKNDDGSWSQHNGNTWAQPAWGMQAQAQQAQNAQPRGQNNEAQRWNGGNAGGGGGGGGQSFQQNLDSQASARQWGGYRAGGGGGGFRGRR